LTSVEQYQQRAASHPLLDLTEQEFVAQIEPYRRELHVHCYRMLGSVQDAEDLVQETLLRAWRRRETFAGRGSLRAWLYKIATNLCLNALERQPRRTLPVMRQQASAQDEAIAPAITEPIWLEPLPDELLAPEHGEPEARFSQRESVSLAFVVLLQQLPPRQRAVLILRDVLDWQASEVSELLGLSIAAVKSALFRARTTLAQHTQTGKAEELAAPRLNEAMQSRLAHYMRAWETANVNEFVALLKADAIFSMPPTPTWFQGREAIRAFLTQTIFQGAIQGQWRLLPTRANGQLAFGVYRRHTAGGLYEPYAIQVLRFAGEQIAEVTTFKNPALVRYFNLPPSLSGDLPYG